MSDSFIVKIIPTEALDKATRNSIIQLCVAAHQEEDFYNLFKYIPSGGRHVLGYVGSDLVSHAVVTTRWLQPESSARLKTAYVDAVATDPSRQGQGHGSGLMKTLAQNIGDYDIACLETERRSFFASLGWEEWAGELAYQKENEWVPTPDQTGIMILRLPQTSNLDLTRSLAIVFDGRDW